MSKAIGMAEYKTVSAGIQAADAMVKTSDVEIIEAQTVCPGKYIVILTGELSAVNAAVETAKTQYGTQLIDSFVLGNPDEAIFPAIYGSTHVEVIKSLGVLETYDAAAIIVAADQAAKTAEVERKILPALDRRSRGGAGGNRPRKGECCAERHVLGQLGHRASGRQNLQINPVKRFLRFLPVPRGDSLDIRGGETCSRSREEI